MLNLKMNIKLRSIALAALLLSGLPVASSSAFVAVSVGIAPPAIPVYEQPYCPVEGYIWTPGYWAYADFGYYWVPGVWVAPPRVGVLWTPGYWGYRGGQYFFNDGYWGPTVGFYGGINYGYGYGGRGYYGGEWAGGAFRYNTAVTRVNTTVIRNTYINKQVINNTGSRAGFNGPGGAQAQATAQEQAAAKAEHVPPTPQQRSRVEAAKNDPALHAANNKGKPKPEAIQALDRKNSQQPAAGAGAADAGKPVKAEKQAGAVKQTGTQRQANAEKRPNAEKQTAEGKPSAAKSKAKAARKTANASRPAGESARTAKTAESHPRKAGRAEQNRQNENPAAAPGIGRRAQAASHRPQVAPGRPVASESGGRASAGGAQPAKKKKRAANGPGGQR